MIRVSDRYVIDVSTLEYTALDDTGRVSENKKTGERTPIYKTIGHYGSLRSAVKGIAEYEAKNEFMGSNVTIATAIKMLRECNEHLERILDTIEVTNG